MIDAPRKWYLSATGYGSDPRQLFAMLRALYKGTEHEEQFRDYKQFVKLYPVDRSNGLRYLRQELRRISLSREADEVMERDFKVREAWYEVRRWQHEVRRGQHEVRRARYEVRGGRDELGGRAYESCRRSMTSGGGGMTSG